MISAILGAEAAFWILLGAGLVARYVLRAQRLSTVLLLCVPLVDVALLVLVAIDLGRGAEPGAAHALAAAYLGFTVAFGHSVIQWADVRFRHRFAGGPPPVKPPKGSREYVAGLWREWFRVVVALVVSSAVLLVMIAFEGGGVPDTWEAASTHPYWGMILRLAGITGIWLLAGPAFARVTSTPDRDQVGVS